MRAANPSHLPIAQADDNPSTFIALLTFVGYYLGAQVGFALTFSPHPISTLWPPNSILLAALLLTPARTWWMILVAALPAHLLGQLQSGVPTPMIVGWYASNCSEALIGALFVRVVVRETPSLDRLSHVVALVVFAVLFAPFASSFLDASLVTFIGWGQGSYWELWRMRFLANVLAALAIVPLILAWAAFRVEAFRSATWHARVEGALLVLMLLVVCRVAFGEAGRATVFSHTLLFLPFAVLLWAALRMGSVVTTTSFFVVVLSAILGTIQGTGPFVSGSPEESVQGLHIFLATLGIPLFILGALMRERKLARGEMTDKDEHLRLALSAARIGTWEWDIRSDSGVWSQTTKDIFGRGSRTHGITLGVFGDLVHPLDRPMALEAIGRAAREGSALEIEHRVQRPDGSVRWVVTKGEVHRDADGVPERLLGVTVDVTALRLADEEMRAAAALRESEAQFRQLADAMPQIVWSARIDGCVDYLNLRGRELLDAKRIPSNEGFWFDILHPQDHGPFVRRWLECLITGRAFEIECRFNVGESGQYRWHLARALPIRAESGALLRWYGTATDIHDHKAVEQNLVRAGIQLQVALRDSEERFTKAFRSGPDALMIFRQADGRILEVNDRWISLFGYQREEGMALGVAQLRMPAAGHAGVRELEATLQAKGGESIEASIGVEELEIDGEPCLIALIRDVTEQRKVERESREQRIQLTHLMRVAVLGELTGALAHELNQPLTAILCNAQATQRVLMREPLNLAEIKESLADIVSEDKRAGEVIGRLRALLKKGELRREGLPIDDIVGEAIDLARGALTARQVMLGMRLAVDLPLVNGDRIQLVQVLLNLIANACEAMENVEPQRRFVVVTTAKSADGMVCVSVADSGPGISRENAAMLFEPFFTTKEQGLGLGLSISRSIVTAHEGRLWADNRPQGGAIFHVSIPAYREAAE